MQNFVSPFSSFSIFFSQYNKAFTKTKASIIIVKKPRKIIVIFSAFDYPLYHRFYFTKPCLNA
ncbi:hypothetical protein CU024_2043 [Enterococcus faecium]|nr:hypothetical protein [Enterococcus faecium]MBL4995302.1 hypothetical protein [Enterococcus lactis]MBK4762721.1 hypothetical protein [Enterococcus faecium]MBK4809111.1 hypothetical protein [Enterococcus faecium]MBK4868159.1 hypothetical protein [Enterococcus faecium]